ncbi:DUF6461 domain-containing protein [Sphaerimonospora thailandensis]
MSSSFVTYERLWPVFPKQCCVTWIRTGESDAVFADLVRRFGGDPSAVHPATWADVEDEAYEDLDEEADGAMLTARHGVWTVVMEPFNVRGTSVRILSEVAADSQAYSVRWTADRRVRVTYVADGELIAAFNPFDLDGVTPRSGRDWLSGVAVTEEQWRRNGFAAGLAVGEELSGVRVDGQWLKQTHLGVQLYPLPLHPVTPADLLDADMQAIARSDPRIGAIAAEPTADKLPEIIRIAAELAVATTGLEGSLIDEAMRFVAAGDRGAAAQDVRSRLYRLRDQYRAEAARGNNPIPGHDTELGRLLLKERAVQALIYALKNDVDLVAAVEYTVQAAEETHLSEENGDRERARVLNVVTYYLRTGTSPW